MRGERDRERELGGKETEEENRKEKGEDRIP